MTRLTLLTLLMVVLLPIAAGATRYEAEAHSAAGGALWLPIVGMRDLVFEPGAELDVQSGSWHLTGSLRSNRFSERTFAIDVVFSNTFTGDEFRQVTGGSDRRIKGTTWSRQNTDWLFAESVSGTVRDLSDPDRVWTVRMMDTRRELHAQLGTELNEKNSLMGLASWLEITDHEGRTSRGGIHLNLKPVLAASPMPEPSAALLFGIGAAVALTRLRRR